MPDYIIQIDLKSSLITPLQSDTLWAHICWAIRYLYGKDELSVFLEAYTNVNPPLLLSSAFPAGCLPSPALRPMSIPKQMVLLKRYWAPSEYSQGLAVIKHLSRIPYLPKSLLEAQNDEPLTEQGLLERIIVDPSICLNCAALMPEPCEYKLEKATGKIACRPLEGMRGTCPESLNPDWLLPALTPGIVFHTAVSRLSGSAMEKQLFSTYEQFPVGGPLEVHCRLEPSFSEDKLKDCLTYISDTGFGKKKSTGKGRIECNLIPAGPSAAVGQNHYTFMTLSNYVPCNGESTEGNYRLITKYGKLGGHYASSSVNSHGKPLPFKYPLVMFAPGSIFKCENVVQPFYGRLARAVHPVKTRIVQYGLAYAYPLNVRW